MLSSVSTNPDEKRACSDVLAYALATSLAPLPNAEKTKAIVVIARIQSYLAVIGGTDMMKPSQEIHQVKDC